MTWIFAGSGLAVAGLAILAVLAVRMVAAARGLGSELDRARRMLPREGDEPPGLRVRSGGTARPSL
ncbi:hypothetical protein ACFHYQ_15590 [Sphaerimonospora cavernae]|uniref:Histidine kinase n=1 Tax=Sphaerimonospora cavernae TaxID=1740611 RepID=A0ABV6U750_9ACTN